MSDKAYLEALDTMTRATVYTARVSEFGQYILADTEHGEILAEVDDGDQVQRGRRQSLSAGGGRLYTWHATDHDGGRWRGVNGGPGGLVTLHRMARCVWQLDPGMRSWCHKRATRQGEQGPSVPWCIYHAEDADFLYGWKSYPLEKNEKGAE